jgi:hypothetical protein
VAYKLYPKGTYIQILAELSNENLAGIENGNNDSEANLFFAPLSYQSIDLALVISKSCL